MSTNKNEEQLDLFFPEDQDLHIEAEVLVVIAAAFALAGFPSTIEDWTDEHDPMCGVEGVYCADCRPQQDSNVEFFKGYRYSCWECGAEHPFFPDYYGVLHTDQEVCTECATQGRWKVVDTKPAWYYRYCMPGCLPDCDPIGSFSTEEEAREYEKGWSA